MRRVLLSLTLAASLAANVLLGSRAGGRGETSTAARWVAPGRPAIAPAVLSDDACAAITVDLERRRDRLRIEAEGHSKRFQSTAADPRLTTETEGWVRAALEPMLAELDDFSVECRANVCRVKTSGSPTRIKAWQDRLKRSRAWRARVRRGGKYLAGILWLEPRDADSARTAGVLLDVLEAFQRGGELRACAARVPGGSGTLQILLSVGNEHDVDAPRTGEVMVRQDGPLAGSAFAACVVAALEARARQLSLPADAAPAHVGQALTLPLAVP